MHECASKVSQLFDTCTASISLSIMHQLCMYRGKIKMGAQVRPLARRTSNIRVPACMYSNQCTMPLLHCCAET